MSIYKQNVKNNSRPRSPVPEAACPRFQVEAAILDVQFRAVLWVGGRRQGVAVFLARKLHTVQTLVNSENRGGGSRNSY